MVLEALESKKTASELGKEQTDQDLNHSGVCHGNKNAVGVQLMPERVFQAIIRGGVWQG